MQFKWFGQNPGLGYRATEYKWPQTQVGNVIKVRALSCPLSNITSIVNTKKSLSLARPDTPSDELKIFSREVQHLDPRALMIKTEKGITNGYGSA